MIKFVQAGLDAPKILIQQTSNSKSGVERAKYEEAFRRMESAVLRSPSYYKKIRYS